MDSSISTVIPSPPIFFSDGGLQSRSETKLAFDPDFLVMINFFTIIMFHNVWQYNVIFQSSDLFQRQISCQKIFLSLDKNS